MSRILIEGSDLNTSYSTTSHQGSEARVIKQLIFLPR